MTVEVGQVWAAGDARYWQVLAVSGTRVEVSRALPYREGGPAGQFELLDYGEPFVWHASQFEQPAALTLVGPAGGGFCNDRR